MDADPTHQDKSMKILLFALLASATLISAANAVPWVQTYHQECTTSASSLPSPSGSYVDKEGHKWAGFKPDGTPPDSLVSSGPSTTTCVSVPDPMPA
jgi:hypothetical protein